MFEKKVSSEVKKEGAGAKVKRLFPSKDMDHYDPFVLLDEFFVESDAGFPKHSHGGFEALTYILEGGFRHEDNLGNDSAITEGGVQRFTAGKGIRHSEMPEGEKTSHGFQLWINLPEKLKGIEPSYQKVSSEEIPKEERDGFEIKKIIDDESPVKVNSEVIYHHFSSEKGGSCLVSLKEGFNSFFYVFEGELKIDGDKIGEEEGYFIDNNEVSLEAEKGTSFIFLSGKPLDETIRLEGSFVR